MVGVLIVAAALAGVYAAYRIWFPWDEQEIERWVEDWLEPLGIWGPLAYIALFAGSMLFAPIPTAPAPVIAATVFGGALGFLYTLIATALGSSICFWISRTLGRRVLRRLMSESAVAKIDELGERLGIRLLIVLRLVPLAGVDYVSYAAGLTRMPFGIYLIISVLGSAPILGLAALLGDSLFDQGWVLAAAALGAIIVVFLAPLAWVAIRGDRKEHSEAWVAIRDGRKEHSEAAAEPESTGVDC